MQRTRPRRETRRLTPPRVASPALKGHQHLLLTPERGLLAASCWCQRAIVAVTPAEVLAGKTASCGRPACSAPEPRPEL